MKVRVSFMLMNARKLSVLPVKVYRTILSPLKPPCCRFTPTCSAYAVEAFQNRGFFVGLFLTVWRLLRCNPFFKGGYDPVPYPIPYKKIDVFNKIRERNAASVSEKTSR
ncbi:MAG: membrane protein insertion efficiency factor YidD [Clostridia bacterium]|nr:membrane protein insertion efficiency factor YidD [Clostridia bacterium]